jgi:hypothetical protein
MYLDVLFKSIWMTEYGLNKVTKGSHHEFLGYQHEKPGVDTMPYASCVCQFPYIYTFLKNNLINTMINPSIRKELK